MATLLSHYLDSVRHNLRLDLSSEREVITELETHIEDRFQELREAGLSEEEAAKNCEKLLGSTKLVARQIYEAHSQGTWGQTLLASMPHLLFALLLLYAIIVQTIKRDWLYSSVMLFPLPIIIGWFLAVESGERFPELSMQRLSDFAPWIGLSFLALALAVAMFIRLRKRWLKVAVLLISGLLTLSMVAYYTKGMLGLPAFLVLILVMLGLFLTPALVERKIRRADQRVSDAKGSYCN